MDSILNPIRIRLSRIRGTGIPKRKAVYNINIANARSPRDGKFLERVGLYESAADIDGIKHFTLDFDRIKYWLSQGAQPTARVASILGNAGILPSIPRKIYPSIENSDAANAGDDCSK